MFAPAGYVSLAALYRDYPKAAKAAFIYDLALMYRSIERHYAERGNHFTLFENVSIADIFEKSFFLKLLADNGWIYLASPTGQVVNIELSSLFSQDFHPASMLSIYDETRPKITMGDLPRHFRWTYLLSDLTNVALQASLEERKDWRSTMEGTLKFYESNRLTTCHRTIPFFHERVGFTVNLDGYEIARRTYPEDADELFTTANTLRPFVGWSMCCPETVATTEWLEKVNAYRDEVVASNAESTGDSAAQRVIGRPATLRESAARAYLELFPEGHGALSWKEALQRVNAHAGIEASVFTLQRAAGILQMVEKSEAKL